MKKFHHKEPLISWTLISVAFNVFQVEALPVPKWLHIALLGVSHIASVMAARQQVTPVE